MSKKVETAGNVITALFGLLIVIGLLIGAFVGGKKILETDEFKKLDKAVTKKRKAVTKRVIEEVKDNSERAYNNVLGYIKSEAKGKATSDHSNASACGAEADEEERRVIDVGSDD